jgi:flagellar biosynthesis protein FliQ
MSIDDVVTIGQRAMLVTLLMAAPMLFSGMVIGLFISVLQSVTQIQEITLTFVPKIVVVLLVFVLVLPWMSDMMLVFITDLFGNMSVIVQNR